MASVLAGKTLGLVGLGRNRRRLHGALRSRAGNDASWPGARTSPDLRAAEAGARRVTKDELLQMGRRRQPPPGAVAAHPWRARCGRDRKLRPALAIFVNTSRAPLVDEAALLDAAGDGRIVAALDVYEREPLPPAHPLLSCPNTVLTPHLGYSVLEVQPRLLPAMRRERARISRGRAGPAAAGGRLTAARAVVDADGPLRTRISSP